MSFQILTYHTAKEIGSAYWLFCKEEAKYTNKSVHYIKNVPYLEEKWVRVKRYYINTFKNFKELLRKNGTATYNFMSTLNEYKKSYENVDDITDAGLASVNYNYKAELNYLLSVNDENREDIDECYLCRELYETRGQ